MHGMCEHELALSILLCIKSVCVWGGGLKPPTPQRYCTFIVNCICCFTCVTASEYCLPLLCLQGGGTLGLHCPLKCSSEATGVQILYPSLPLSEVSISLWPHATLCVSVMQ